MTDDQFQNSKMNPELLRLKFIPPHSSKQHSPHHDLCFCTTPYRGNVSIFTTDTSSAASITTATADQQESAKADFCVGPAPFPMHPTASHGRDFGLGKLVLGKLCLLDWSTSHFIGALDYNAASVHIFLDSASNDGTQVRPTSLQNADIGDAHGFCTIFVSERFL
jgi:hypothetical protein